MAVAMAPQLRHRRRHREWSAPGLFEGVYENAFPKEGRKRAMKWLKLHAQYDMPTPGRSWRSTQPWPDQSQRRASAGNCATRSARATTTCTVPRALHAARGCAQARKLAVGRSSLRAAESRRVPRDSARSSGHQEDLLETPSFTRRYAQRPAPAGLPAALPAAAGGPGRTACEASRKPAQAFHAIEQRVDPHHRHRDGIRFNAGRRHGVGGAAISPGDRRRQRRDRRSSQKTVESKITSAPPGKIPFHVRQFAGSPSSSAAMPCVSSDCGSPRAAPRRSFAPGLGSASAALRPRRCADYRIRVPALTCCVCRRPGGL